MLFAFVIRFCSFQFKHLPVVFKEPGEGKINKDLPSCWECPKCYQGKDSASEVLKYISYIYFDSFLL